MGNIDDSCCKRIIANFENNEIFSPSPEEKKNQLNDDRYFNKDFLFDNDLTSRILGNPMNNGNFIEDSQVNLKKFSPINKLNGQAKEEGGELDLEQNIDQNKTTADYLKELLQNNNNQGSVNNNNHILDDKILEIDEDKKLNNILNNINEPNPATNLKIYNSVYQPEKNASQFDLNLNNEKLAQSLIYGNNKTVDLTERINDNNNISSTPLLYSTNVNLNNNNSQIDLIHNDNTPQNVSSAQAILMSLSMNNKNNPQGNNNKFETKLGESVISYGVNLKENNDDKSQKFLEGIVNKTNKPIDNLYYEPSGVKLNQGEINVKSSYNTLTKKSNIHVESSDEDNDNLNVNDIIEVSQKEPQNKSILKKSKDNETVNRHKTDQTKSNRKEAERIIRQLKKMSGLEEDRAFNLEGWKDFYKSNEKFFLYDHGDVISDQYIIEGDIEDERACAVYKGDVNEARQKHGFGTIFTKDSITQGDFREDELNGWGRIAKKNGEIFVCKMVDGKPNGKGIYKNEKGYHYKGEFEDGKRTGVGRLKTPKFLYDGNFLNNKLQGKGKIKFLKNGHIYEGDFDRNEMSGYGIFKWKNGDVYEGEMYKGVMEGKGKYIYADGEVYEGNYKNGLKHGFGKIFYTNATQYQGTFKNGYADGEGKYIEGNKIRVVYYKDGKIISQ